MEDSVEDSLTKEMNKLTCGNLPYSSFSYRSASPGVAASSYSEIRPITTGVLDIKNKYYGIRKNIDSYVETSTPTGPAPGSATGRNTINKHRPRAPLSSRFSHAQNDPTQPSAFGRGQGEDQLKEQTKGKRGDRNKSKQTKRNKKSKSIDVLWESLQHFSKNNLGRSLADTDVSTMVNSPGEGVHFVNLHTHEDDSWDDSNISSSAFHSSQKSLINKSEEFALSNQRVFSLPREPVERVTTNSSLSQLTSLPSTNFTIPELPSGNLLTINILSTWGDPHYVGLMGIEIFDKSGHVVRLSNLENQIWANPADINVLSEYGRVPLPLFSFLLLNLSSLSSSASLWASVAVVRFRSPHGG
jgi:hypothetical protein